MYSCGILRSSNSFVWWVESRRNIEERTTHSSTSCAPKQPNYKQYRYGAVKYIYSKRVSLGQSKWSGGIDFQIGKCMPSKLPFSVTKRTASVGFVRIHTARNSFKRVPTIKWKCTGEDARSSAFYSRSTTQEDPRTVLRAARNWSSHKSGLLLSLEVRIPHH